MLKTEIWHRRILKAYWIIVIFMMIAQFVFVKNVGRLDLKISLNPVESHLFIVCNLLIVTFMIAAELWLRFSKLPQNMGWFVVGFSFPTLCILY